MACSSSSSSVHGFLRPSQKHHQPKLFPTSLSLSFPSTPTSLSFSAQKPQIPFPASAAGLTASLATSPSPASTSLDFLSHHLSSGDLRLADEETRRLLIALAGDAAIKRGYVFFSEVRFIPDEALLAVDSLWLQHTGGRFGYSVQRRIWEKQGRDFTRLFVRLGWMKKLDSEVEQYTYRSFPEEFTWELAGGAPDGHLPLTNALRGTQLLGSILMHPAFDGGEVPVVEGEDKEEAAAAAVAAGGGLKKLMGSLKTDYSF